MSDEKPNNSAETRIEEIKRLISEFEEQFRVGTMDERSFMTMSDLEKIWGTLQSNTNSIYSDMVRELMSSVDERKLIRKKKANLKPEE